MNCVYMTGYKVKGIKTLDQLVELSFYKKTLTNPIETQEYNIKGIYGKNGTGKSGIITSADILRKLLTSVDYLNNPIVQRSLSELINKKVNELFIEIDYLLDLQNRPVLFRYEVTLGRGINGKYSIIAEELYSKSATSRKEEFDRIIEVKNGELIYIRKNKNDNLPDLLAAKTTNLLGTASIASLFFEKILINSDYKESTSDLFISLFGLVLLGNRISVSMELSDDHSSYSINNILHNLQNQENNGLDAETIIKKLRQNLNEVDRSRINVFSVRGNIVPHDLFEEYTREVRKLQDFLCIFKTDLVKIDIDKKERGTASFCNLIMVYDSYSIDVEFESTGIKKLIKLFLYFEEMVEGGIVFIDELDSNLHDVYLCALLEYLMKYGKGQLCFTTHNVGPMDVLKKQKKSIDFLSEDHKVYPWKTNGNYSPSKLYRSGMIEGSPFNVDATDFIGILDSLGEDSE